jgi:opacity protein-like surface antigen
MRRLYLAATILLVLASSALAEDTAAVNEARSAATAWLALTDTAQYGQSWDEASSFFQAAITKVDWERALKGARAPLGTLKARKLKTATFTRTLPGAPDGEYVVIQFDTQFENKAAAVETVTPMREKDGSWRVGGYFIK